MSIEHFLKFIYLLNFFFEDNTHRSQLSVNLIVYLSHITLLYLYWCYSFTYNIY